MDWQQILSLAIILGIGVIFVWRGSSPKKHQHDGHCGCGHEREAASREKDVSR